MLTRHITMLSILACAVLGACKTADSPAAAGNDDSQTSAPSQSESGRSVMCSMIYQPVCGVDGKTYPNACHASRSRVKIAHAGGC